MQYIVSPLIQYGVQYALTKFGTVYFNVPNWGDSRQYIHKAYNSSFIQYVANCMLDFTPDYDTTASHVYSVYFAPSITETVVPTPGIYVPSTIQFNTTTSTHLYTSDISATAFDGYATYGYHSPLSSYIPIQLNSVGGTIEVNDIVCNRINGQQVNFGIYAYGSNYNGTVNVNSTLNTINSTTYQVLCTGCKGIITVSGTASSTVTLQYNYTTEQYNWSITIASGAKLSYMIV